MRKIYILLLTSLFAVTTNAQIGVTVTNPTNTTPNLAASYTSLANALTALNATTAMSGPVTFTLAAGTSETAPPTGLIIGSATLNPVLSAVNTITIVKAAGSATVLNAGVGTATPGSAAPDGILKLTGADYITITGLTFTDGNVTNPATMEFGVGLFKFSAGDGCNNNTIQNCIFNMQNINNATGTAPMIDGAVGILVINSTANAATTSITPTNGGTLSTNGTNSGNKFYGNTINGGNIGIGLSGYATAAGVGPSPTATTFLGDLGNDIGGVAAPTGNTILNYGGAAAATNPAAGIRANNQWSANIQYNNINNNNGSGANHVTTLRGIYGQAGTSANVTISNNTITLKGGGTTTVLTAIENVIGATAAANTVTITGNIIQNCTYTTATTATFTGILAAASAANQNVNSNQVINNTIGAAGTGSSCIFQGIYASASSTTFTANSNTISGNTLANNFGTIYSIRASTSILTYDGNTISNNTIPNNTGATSSSIYGFYDASSPVTETYTNNNINNLNITGNSTSTANIIYGMYILTASGVKTISGNNINNLNFTSSSTGYAGINGIRDAYASTGNIFKNVVHSLSSTGATPTIQGIIFGTSVGTTYNVYNNIVGNLTAPQSTGFNIMGIYGGAAGTTYNVSFNTVYLNGTSSGSGSGTAAMYMSSTTPTTNLNDNIFVNLCTPTGAGITSSLRRTAAALTAYGTTSNNNLFYAGAPSANNLLYYDGTNSYTSMSAFKAAVTPRETVSFSEAVSSTPGVFFQSLTGPATGSPTTFLHLVNGLVTQCESGGAPIAGITDDYDGNIRNVATPDVGADEFTGTLPPSMTYISSTTTQNNISNVGTNATNQEVIGIQIVTAGLLNPLNATSFTLNTNGTTNLANIANAKLFYTGNSSTFAATTQFGATVPAPSGSFIIAGSQGLATGTNYFWLTYDVVCGATLGQVIDGECNSLTVVSPQTPTVQAPAGSRTIVLGPLSGTYTVGGGGNYATLTAAVADLNAKGMGGNTTFSILNSLAEAGAITINQWAECGGSGFTLTIKPAPATSPTVSASVAGAFIILNGADRVTIDGSNNGTASRDMTISNTSAATPTVILITSLGAGLGATNNTIKNCNLTTGVAASIGYGVSVGNTPGTAGADNDNVTIQNNNITAAPVGIYANGTAAVSAGGDDNLIITGNQVTYNNVATGLASIGIQVGNTLTSLVNQNTVSEQTSTSQAPTGISLETGFVSSTVNGNMVTAALTTNTGGYGGRGITVGTGSAASNLTISNNVIYGVNGSNWSGFTNSSSMGIVIGGIGSSSTLTTTAGGINLYFNSVNMTGSMGSASTAAITTAIYIGTGASALNIRNNAFVNTQVATSATQKNYAIYSAAANTAFTTINYNDYFVSNTFNPASAFVGFLTSDRATLANWQTASGQDLNSISSDPLFNSATLLRPLAGSPLLAAGVAGTGITVDFLGTARGTPPSIGAYEAAGDFGPPTITYTPISNTLCIANKTIVATITDASGVNVAVGTKPRVYYKKTTNANVLPGTNTNTTDGWKYAEASNAGSPFNLTIDNSLIFGSVAAGDVIQYFVVAQDLAGTPNVGINSGTFAVLPASVALTATAFPVTGTINSYSFSASGLSSNVTIGAAGTYTSLTGAGGLFSVLNAGGLNANITATILDASVTETGANALNQMAYGCGGPYTLTIVPNTGVTSTLTGSLASSALIRILSNNVTIDGSNNGTTSRNLTITNTSATTPSVLLFGSTGTTPITNSTVKNSIIINGVNTATAVVVSDGATLGAAGYFNNITIQNNSIQKAYMGIYNIAVVAAGNGSGLNINSNLINTTGANQLRFCGIYVQGVDGATVSGNNIGNFETTSGETKRGIWFATGTTNSVAEKNTIHDITYTGTSGYGAYGIAVSTGLLVANIDVRNNMIFGLSGDGDSFASFGGTYLPAGIYVFGAGQGGVNLYYNTIYLSGNTLNFSAATYSFGILLDNDAKANIKDNIINNNLGRLTTIGVGAVGIGAATSAAQFTSLDYNDYWVASTGSGTNSVGKIGATDYATLAAFKTATGADANSINVQPVYVSATNPHLSTAIGANWCLNGTGLSIPTVPTDIDGDTRSTGIAPNGPDMGADEFIATSDAVATPSSQTICSGVNTPNLIVFSGSATSYNWVRDNPGVTGTIGLSGTGNVSGTLINVTSAPITVTFTITPILAGPCPLPTFTATVTVTPDGTITLTSGAGTNNQTVCINTPITNITYAVGGSGTGGSVSGLPAGVTGSFAGGVITISGTPTASGVFNYTVNTTGPCVTPTANGTITVTPDGTITLTSAPGTNNQTVCINTPIVNITYAVGGSGTGGSVSGLPAGITVVFAAGVITISGTPTASGVFNYTVTTTGPCVTPTANGTITVTANGTVSLTSAPGTNNQTVCINTPITNITYAVGGSGTGGSVSGLPAGVTGSFAGGVITISGTPTASGVFNYTVTTTGPCVNPTANGTITVTANGTVTLTSAPGTNNQTVCINSPIATITYAVGGSGTGGSVSGLPAGVTGSFAGGVITISGTPTASGVFNYTVTTTGPCVTPTANGTITVNPLPVLSAVLTQPTTCVSADGAINLTVSGTPGPYTYNWTTNGGSGIVNGIEDQSGLTVGQYTVVVTDITTGCQQTAVYNLTGPGGCSICPTIGAITMSPSTTICANTNVTLTASGLTSMGVTYGITFKYSLAPLADPYVGGTVIGTVANGSLTGGGTVASLTTLFAASGNYIIYAILSPTPTDPFCRPSSQSNLTVGQVPTVNPVANQILCNGASTASVTFSGTGSGTVYNWINNTPSIGLAASGSGNIPSFTATNAGTAPVTATITVTPSITTVGTLSATQSFNYTGAMQTWIVPAGVTSITIDASGAQGGNGAAGTISAGGNGGNGSRSSGTLAVVPGQVLNIFVGGGGATPAGGFNGGGAGGTANAGGGGGASDVRYPGVTAADRLIVGGGGGGGGRAGCLSSALGGNGGSGGGNGTNGQDAATVGGFAGGGAGAVGPTGGAKGIGCAGFSGLNGSTAVDENGAAGGLGQICCCPSQPGGGGGGGGLIGGGGGGGGSAGTTACSGNDKGGGGGGAGGSNYTGGVSGGSTVNGVQTGNGLVVITYNIPGPTVVCSGTPTSFTITVNPTPNAVATPSSQTICSAATITTIVLSGNVAGTVFNWTRNNTVAVTGIAASGAGNISGALTNTTFAPVTVTFTITPTANGCTGTPVTATVLVNPTPNAVATPASQTICSANAITTIVLTGSVAGTTFNWTRNNTATATGIAASGSGNISGTLTNITNGPVTVTFTITPTANGCAGTAITATVLVNPTPNVSAAPPSQTICSGSSITPIVLSSTTNGGDAIVNGGFETGSLPPWTILSAVPAPVVNATSPRTGSFAAFLGSLNGGPEPLGDATMYQTITVPATGGTLSYWYQGFTTDGIAFDWQDAYITNTSGTILTTLMHVCTTNAYTQVTFNMAPYAGQTVRVVFLVHQDGFGDVTNMYVDDVTLITPAVITYNWTRDNNATVTGIAASGSGSPITGTLTNTTFAPVTVTFTITPTSNGCIGTPALATVLVNPTPNAIATPSSQTICSGTAITTIALSSSVSGTTYAWTRNNTATVTGIAASGTGNISGTLTNTTTAPVTVTFTITPTANGCVGTPITATVIVQAPLIITCPGNITVPSIVGGCTAIVTYAPVVTGTPAPTFTYTQVGATTGSGSGTGSGLAYNVGVTTVTITATNICSTVSCSFTITVTDSQLPVVTTQPANQTVCVGSSAVFAVVATNTLSYQWQSWNGSAWVNIAGATASTLTVSGVTFSMNTNSYRVNVTGLCSTVSSGFASLYVNQLPAVSISASRPPVLLPGQLLTLTAVVSPGGGAYQWYKNGVAIAGATTATLSNLSVDDVGTYTVRYTDPNGCVQTSAGMVVSSETSGNIYLYPNPNSGHFQIRFNNRANEKVTVNIYDEKGAMVYRQTAVTTIAYTSIVIDISNLPSETYLVAVIGEDGRLIGARRVSVTR